MGCSGTLAWSRGWHFAFAMGKFLVMGGGHPASAEEKPGVLL